MSKHRPHGPKKGHSPGRPKSGRRTLSGARPGGGSHGRKKYHAAGKHGDGPKRRDRVTAGSAAPSSRASEPRTRVPFAPGKPERLQKLLAQAGLGSRRGCEELITQGRVSVDGQVVRELGTRVDPSSKIAVDGESIRLESLVYFAVNKPEGYVSTNADPSGRPRVVDLVAEVPERVYTVGRLDEDSTGLMILTNDGALANRLAHPKYGVEKLYQALVAGAPTPESLTRLTEGVWLSDGKVRAKRVRIAGHRGQATLLELVLAEGKKREIRRMLAKLGHKVMSLHRVAIGPIAIRGLQSGESRPLTKHEVELLRKVAAGESVSVPGFPDVRPTRAPRAPRKSAAQGGPTAAPPERRRHHKDAEGPPRGPSRRPAPSRPEAPAPPRGPSRRPAPSRSEAPAPPPAPPTMIQGPDGTPRPSGPRPKRGPASAPAPAPRGSRPPQERPARGPQSRKPAGPRPNVKRTEEPERRRRIIGLEGPAAEILGGGPAGRKRPPARKPKPPRTALGPRPGRLRPPRSDDHQDSE